MEVVSGGVVLAAARDTESDHGGQVCSREGDSHSLNASHNSAPPRRTPIPGRGSHPNPTATNSPAAQQARDRRTDSWTEESTVDIRAHRLHPRLVESTHQPGWDRRESTWTEGPSPRCRCRPSAAPVLLDDQSSLGTGGEKQHGNRPARPRTLASRSLRHCRAGVGFRSRAGRMLRGWRRAGLCPAWSRRALRRGPCRQGPTRGVGWRDQPRCSCRARP
ncbi:MAG: hypothetical protein QOG76_8307 [Pseudonocardiales bacterium]|nr:hypothetical protein [Pseudonocardiales bacterium]